DRASSANARDKAVNFAAKRTPDFLRSRLTMNLRVCRVLELLRHKCAIAIFGQQLVCALNGARHALWTWRENDLGAKEAKQHTTLNGHGLGHGEDALVALRRAHEGQGDP